MTLQEAKEKAKKPMQATTAAKDPYAIPFELSEWAKSMVGKKLGSIDPNNKNVMEIIEWIGQNYILKINDSDYNVSPVMWTYQVIKDKKIQIR